MEDKVTIRSITADEYLEKNKDDRADRNRVLKHRLRWGPKATVSVYGDGYKLVWRSKSGR